LSRRPAPAHNLRQIVQALIVNSIKFACSAALPAILPHTLAPRDLPTLEDSGCILLCDVFFMLDNLVIFSLAELALDTSIGQRYAGHCRLVGGVARIALGGVTVFGPGCCGDAGRAKLQFPFIRYFLRCTTQRMFFPAMSTFGDNGDHYAKIHILSPKFSSFSAPWSIASSTPKRKRRPLCSHWRRGFQPLLCPPPTACPPFTPRPQAAPGRSVPDNNRSCPRKCASGRGRSQKPG